MTERGAEEFEPDDDTPAEHADAPEADYLEQHEDVLPEYRKGPTIAPDVPEADALEQAIDAGYDDDAAVEDAAAGRGDEYDDE
jgi:hypothetical protein